MWTGTVLLWSIISFSLGAGFVYLLTVIKSKNWKINWYEWVLGLLGVAILVITIQNFYASFTEQRESAAWFFLVFPGLFSVVFLVAAFQLAWRRNKAVS